MKQLGVWRYRKFHPSYLLMWLACGVLGGLLLAKFWGWHIDNAIVLGAALTLLGIFRSRRWWAVGMIVVVGLVLGVSRGSLFVDEINEYKKYAGAQNLVGGVIFDDPVYGDRGEQRFRISSVEIKGAPMVGQVFVSTYSILDVKRGDRVELRGKIRDGFGSYQATVHFATVVKAERADNPVREVRDGFAASVRNIVAEPAASLGLGFVVGQRSALPTELDEQMRIVGLTHIVVASGYNLTILVRFARRIFAPHSKYLAALVSTGLMTGFVLVSGLSPSMTRASAVTGLSLLAWYYGRRFQPVLLILYVAAATAWWYPIYVWSDIGWYLSFLAFAGVLILAPITVKAIYRQKEAPAIGQLVIETIAAQIMTLPLILFIFGQLPVLSLLANVLVAPAIPLAMVATALAGLAGAVSATWLGIFGVAANYVLGYVIKVVELLAGVAWAQADVSIPAIAMWGLYALVVVAVVTLAQKTRHNFRGTSVVD
jgi:competence protein ComEC